MRMKKVELVNNEIYHIYNRGTDKRNIFMDQSDYYRFLRCLTDFNDLNPTLDWRREKDFSDTEVEPPKIKVVDIVAYCLMPNHYHLLLRQISDGGVVKFMRKLGTGYTMYFNLKNERSGVLFQGRYKAKHVDDNTYLQLLINYIHANPLDLKPENHDPIATLDSYKWSSWHEYTDKKIIKPLINPALVEELLDSRSEYTNSFNEWLKMKDEDQISHLMMD